MIVATYKLYQSLLITSSRNQGYMGFVNDRESQLSSQNWAKSCHSGNALISDGSLELFSGIRANESHGLHNPVCLVFSYTGLCSWLIFDLRYRPNPSRKACRFRTLRSATVQHRQGFGRELSPVAGAYFVLLFESELENSPPEQEA